MQYLQRQNVIQIQMLLHVAMRRFNRDLLCECVLLLLSVQSARFLRASETSHSAFHDGVSVTRGLAWANRPSFLSRASTPISRPSARYNMNQLMLDWNSRYLAPFWSIASAAQRIAFVATVSSRSFSKHFRDVYEALSSQSINCIQVNFHCMILRMIR